MALHAKKLNDWITDDAIDCLKTRKDLTEYCEIFYSEKITGKTLELLSKNGSLNQELREIGVRKLGDRVFICDFVEQRLRDDEYSKQLIQTAVPSIHRKGTLDKFLKPCTGEHLMRDISQRSEPISQRYKNQPKFMAYVNKKRETDGGQVYREWLKKECLEGRGKNIPRDTGEVRRLSRSRKRIAALKLNMKVDSLVINNCKYGNDIKVLDKWTINCEIYNMKFNCREVLRIETAVQHEFGIDHVQNLAKDHKKRLTENRIALERYCLEAYKHHTKRVGGNTREDKGAARGHALFDQAVSSSTATYPKQDAGAHKNVRKRKAVHFISEHGEPVNKNRATMDSNKIQSNCFENKMSVEDVEKRRKLWKKEFLRKHKLRKSSDKVNTWKLQIEDSDEKTEPKEDENKVVESNLF